MTEKNIDDLADRIASIVLEKLIKKALMLNLTLHSGTSGDCTLLFQFLS